MNQDQYDNIVKAIDYGMPARAKELVNALNTIMQLASERVEEIKAMEDKQKESSEVKESK